jgi:hypothetical protein
MSQRRVVLFEPAHYLAAVRAVPGDTVATSAARQYLDAGPCYTGLVNDDIAAVAGVALLGYGVGMAWAVVTDVGRANPHFVHRATVANLARVIREHRLIRLEAKVVQEFSLGRLWVERMGFLQEGIHPLAGPSAATMITYALLPRHRYVEDGITHVLERGREFIEVEDRLVPAISGGYDGGASIFAIIATVAAIAGTAVSAYSAYSQGEAQAGAAKFNARVAENNATIAQQTAAAQARQKEDAYRRVLGANRAATGAAGVEGDSGSPLLVMADNAAQAELDLQFTKYRGAIQQTGFQSEANLNRYQAGYARQAGIFGAGTTLLSGASKIAGAYAGYGTTRSPKISGLYGASGQGWNE